MIRFYGVSRIFGTSGGRGRTTALDRVHFSIAVSVVTQDMDEAARLGDCAVLTSPCPERILEAATESLLRPRPLELETDPVAASLEVYPWRHLRALPS